jgi:hypothetical protein
VKGEERRDSSQNVSGVALRDRGVERAHRIRNTLNGAVADANFVGNFQNAFASPQMIADALFNGCADPRPTKRAVEAKRRCVDNPHGTLRRYLAK